LSLNMNFYTALVSSVLFPVHERLKRHTSVALRKRLEVTQWLSTEQINLAQAVRLRGFLTDVGRHVSYYRELFQDVGFDPAKVNAVADLQGLPFLTKTLIRSNTDALKRDGVGPLTRYNTGGSSGEPLIFFIGKDRVSHDVAAKWRATRWWDVDVGDPELVVWGSPIELGKQDRVKKLRDAMLRTSLISAFEMSEVKLDLFVEAILVGRPKMLFGYPSALAHIARHAQKKGKAMDKLGIKVVFVTSERLYDDQRATISKVFGCPVANGYGGRDAGFIAHECPMGNLHISAEDIVVETVLPDGTAASAGESGEIVVTHMATRDFPFVRYRTGDRGVLGTAPCGCGRGLPVLREVQGRSTDFIVAADGTVLHGLALIYPVRDQPSVEKFQIEQVSLELTIVRLVVNDNYDSEVGVSIVRDFLARLGSTVEIRLEIVQDIPPAASGKYRYVMSHVDAF
jgi:phenylacetate-CoA ligase